MITINSSHLPDKDSPKNWAEDSLHENGNYICQCSECKDTFLGHKRRTVCKECRWTGNPTMNNKETVRHQLEYSSYSTLVSWCPICNQHFYNDRNKEHTTIATEEHYHEIIPPIPNKETVQEAAEKKSPTQILYDNGIDIMLLDDSFNCAILQSMEEYKYQFNLQSNQQQQQGDGWISVKDQLPTKEDCFDDYGEVLTIQVGRKRPTMMKFWEIKDCPFTKLWLKIPAPPAQ